MKVLGRRERREGKETARKEMMMREPRGWAILAHDLRRMATAASNLYARWAGVEMSEQLVPYGEVKPRQWDLEERGNSGVFAVSRAGALLFRVELAIGMLYLWDKKAGKEIKDNAKESFEEIKKQLKK